MEKYQKFNFTENYYHPFPYKDIYSFVRDNDYKISWKGVGLGWDKLNSNYSKLNFGEKFVDVWSNKEKRTVGYLYKVKVPGDVNPGLQFRSKE